MLDLIRVLLSLKDLCLLLYSPASNFPLLSTTAANFMLLSTDNAVKQISFRKLCSLFINDTQNTESKNIYDLAIQPSLHPGKNLNKRYMHINYTNIIGRKSSLTMSKKTRKINNPTEYKKSSFKDIIEDTEDAKIKALESAPKVKKEQIPSDNETSKEILYGGGDRGDGNNE